MGFMFEVIWYIFLAVIIFSILKKINAKINAAVMGFVTLAKSIIPLPVMNTIIAAKDIVSVLAIIVIGCILIAHSMVGGTLLTDQDREDFAKVQQYFEKSEPQVK